MTAIRNGLCCALLVAAGCGGPVGPPSEPVSGRVLLGDRPVTGATVRFYNSSFGGGAYNLGPDGSFTAPEPLPIGKYEVSLDRPAPIPGATPAETVWPEDETGSLPRQYLSPKTSGLTADVVAGRANVFDFKLRPGPKSGSAKAPTGPTPIAPTQPG